MIAKLFHSIANLPFIKRILTRNRFFVRLFFNMKYRNPDPYEVTTSDEEREKYQNIVTVIGVQERYDSILEVGCGEGHLTKMITDKGKKILAVDISSVAINRAKKNVAGFNNVEVRRFDIFSDDPCAMFDLVILSEVLFYFEPDQLPGVVKRIKSWVEKNGRVALIHTLVKSDDGKGVDLKKFGAKTIHGMFTSDPDYKMTYDETFSSYRITMVQKNT